MTEDDKELLELLYHIGRIADENIRLDRCTGDFKVVSDILEMAVKNIKQRGKAK